MKLIPDNIEVGDKFETDLYTWTVKDFQLGPGGMEVVFSLELHGGHFAVKHGRQAMVPMSSIQDWHGRYDLPKKWFGKV